MIMGPAMICMKKHRATYQSLFQKIAAYCPEIKHQLKAYSTDSESPLRQALELEFPFGQGFICRTHIVRNLEHKIKSELNLSDKFFRKVVAIEDLFGYKAHEGLVHCKTQQEYDLSKLSVKWNKEEIEQRKRKGDAQAREPMASKCFLQHKADIVHHHCRCQALHEVGIDDQYFNHNDPESINAPLKKWENRERMTFQSL